MRLLGRLLKLSVPHRVVVLAPSPRSPADNQDRWGSIVDDCKNCMDFENIELDKMEKRFALVDRPRKLLRLGQREAAKELEARISAVKMEERKATHRLVIHKATHLVGTAVRTER